MKLAMTYLQKHNAGFFTIMFVFLALLYSILYCSKFQRTSSTGVIELDDGFRAISSNGKWLVLFYTPWCSRSIDLFLCLEDIASNKSITGLLVAKLDVNTYKTFSSSIGITSTPTVLFYNYGIKYELSGDLSKISLLGYIESISANLLVEISEQSQFRRILVEHKVFFLCIYNETVNTLIHEMYSNAAIGLKHKAKFFYALNIIFHKEIFSYPSFVVYKNSQPYFYEGEISVLRLNRWIHQEQYDIFPQIHYSDMYHIVSNSKNLLLGIFAYSDDHSIETQKWNKTIFTLARERKFIDNIFILSTSSCDIIEKVIGACPKLPRFVIWNTSNLLYFELGIYMKERFAPEVDLNITILEQFIKMVLRRETISISGYSYWFAVEAIFADISGSQMRLLYFYPIFIKLFPLILISVCFVSCLYIRRSVYNGVD
ncbi:Protein disulfide-isomerase 2-like [Oopsacas minuta]|uniref:Protein disulfide-isomerase 2-like n=1 Tax=Oopsacas minuta TaxID=111878 RepID=A0AAV7K2H8_9METZ|nr:Protein disulfide-isomerase 2-like [Oopsacas minuta]